MLCSLARSIIGGVILSLLSLCAMANSAVENQDNLAKYVSVNIEIKELKDSGVILRDASEKLALALDTIPDQLHELSPEQLAQINILVDKVDQMTSKLNQTVNDLPKTIKSAQAPSNELLQQSLVTIREETVAPIVDSVNRWLIITIIGVCLLGAGLLFAFIFLSKKVASVGSSVVDIAEGYRIIPVEQYKTSKEPERSYRRKLRKPE